MSDSAPETRWRLFVDTGGTFTDALGIDPHDALHRAKVLSSGGLRARVVEVVGPRDLRLATAWRGCDDLVKGFTLRSLNARAAVRILGYESATGTLLVEDASAFIAEEAVELQSPFEAPILAARLMIGVAADAPLPPLDMRLATTRATNALLERSLTPTAFFITEGFGDLLLIGDQHRPDLFAIDVRKSAPIYARVVEVRQRLDAAGAVVKELDEAHLAAAAQRCVAEGVSTAAICLLHADLNPEAESLVERILRRCGFRHVSCSAAISPLPKILPRAQTTVVNAALSGSVEAYLDGVRRDVTGGRVHVMTSAGGLVGAEHVRPVELLLSGPAGGVIGAIAAGAASGLHKIIGVDMGGTSTDVARMESRPEIALMHRVGDAEVAAPAILIESIAAGGGSLCWVDGPRLRVGPRSAGARPGPACYGLGGPLTLTDVHLLLGRIDASTFGIPLDREAAQTRLNEVLAELDRSSKHAEEVLRGFIDVANERMAEAIRTASVRRGFDVEEHALLAFGGAGGLHACALAERLGIRQVLLPVDAGLLSAKGLMSARVERTIVRSTQRTVSAETDWAAVLEPAEAEARSLLSQEGVPPAQIDIVDRSLEMKLTGQESTLTIPAGSDPIGDFRTRYAALFGVQACARDVVVESVRVTAAQRQAALPAPMPSDAHQIGFPRTGVLRREELRCGDEVHGPAIVVEAHCTAYVEPGWAGRMDASGAIVLERIGARDSAPMLAEAQLEVDVGRLEAIAADMGEMLRRTAVSTNVKERLDFSCAVLDGRGELVVNAPHVPVHLGSLGVCVRTVVQRLPLRPGDVTVTNHPGFGGSHLPDVTVVTAAFDADGSVVGYLAARAHHAEIGGILPGSMPPHATRLSEEGVVLPPMLVVQGGVSRLGDVEELLRSAPFPSRAVEDNLADLRAAIAAVRFGAASLESMVRTVGPKRLNQHINLLKTATQGLIEEALQRLDPPVREAVETLDDGTRIAVRLDASRLPIRISFARSSPTHPGNLNATEAIVRSVVLYVLRLLAGEKLPLNEGFMRSVTVEIPRGCFLNPDFPPDPGACPAVGAGNTETSQRLAGMLIRLFGLAAASQETMNNVVFGNDRFGFYETVGGGTGAGEGFHGADAVHSHMTNTRLTDVELLERRYPIVIDRFAVRRGSGGAGRWRGGDGIARAYRFLEEVSLTVIGQHRITGPAGLRGGADGLPARQSIVRANGVTEELPAGAFARMRAGDCLMLETPGGGGWKNASAREDGGTDRNPQT